MVKRGDNTAPIGEQYTADERMEWMLLDKMPKPVRQALVEAKYIYSATQIWGVQQSTKKQLQAEFPFRTITDWQAWQAVIEMIDLNDRDLAKQERQMYNGLVVQFAEERRQRIERAFQKAS